jgi:hypothetical protein
MNWKFWVEMLGRRVPGKGCDLKENSKFQVNSAKFDFLKQQVPGKFCKI